MAVAFCFMPPCFIICASSSNIASARANDIEPGSSSMLSKKVFNLFFTTVGSGVPSIPLPVVCAICILKSAMIECGESSPILPAIFTTAPRDIA